MTVERPVQTSFMEGMDRPVGPILTSVFQGSNSDLMAAVAPLYLTGSVLDVTYGNGETAGGWWKRYQPDPFVFHDLQLDGVDFRDLPHDDREFGTVCYDPPYIASGGAATSKAAADFRSRFGLAVGRSAGGLDALVLDGLAECCRVADDYLLVKCMEFVQSGLRDMPTDITNAARELGWKKHDQIVHYTGTGPGGHNIFHVKRARRAHSYLLVFSRGAS